MNSSTICEGCLSTNRKLSSISGNDRQVFTSILDNSDYVSNPLALCWECTAIIKKIIKYKRQVQNAHRHLISSMLRQTKLLPSLSNLTYHTNTPESHIILSSDNSDHLKKSQLLSNSTNKDNAVCNVRHNEQSNINPSSNFCVVPKEKSENKFEKGMQDATTSVSEREPVFVKVELEEAINFEQELETTDGLDDSYENRDVTLGKEIVLKSDPMEYGEDLSSGMKSDTEFNDSDEEPLKKKKKEAKPRSGKTKKETVAMSDTNLSDVSASELLQNDDLCVVDRHQYTIELQKYYSRHKEKSKKTEWSNEKIRNIIKLIQEYNVIRELGRRPTNRHYHHAKKYDVIEIGNKKVLTVRKKCFNGPVIQIVPSSNYYRLILETHVATNHGRRDKIVRCFKNKFLVPVFAITIFLRMCKTCIRINKGLPRKGAFVEPLRYDFNNVANQKLRADANERDSGQANVSNNSSNTLHDSSISISEMSDINTDNNEETGLEKIVCNNVNTERNASYFSIHLEEQNISTCHICNEKVSEADICEKCKTIDQEQDTSGDLNEDLLVPMRETNQIDDNKINDIYVDRNQFAIDLQKYYRGHKEKSKKPEWTYDKIQNVIKLIQEFYAVKALGKKPSRTQYHHARKYDVISVANKKVLIIKRKSLTDPVVQIVPSNEYYKMILDTHLATRHGRRDKIVKTFKNKYVVPKFAIMIFLQLCKTCLNKKPIQGPQTVFVEPLRCDFNEMAKLNSGNEQNIISIAGTDNIVEQNITIL
ncbi:hypothetical protein evm_006213 [Chilo suppressalis]|nr:hypothetical protein evm_006213 [Chilo suppressalis]